MSSIHHPHHLIFYTPHNQLFKMHSISNQYPHSYNSSPINHHNDRSKHNRGYSNTNSHSSLSHSTNYNHERPYLHNQHTNNQRTHTNNNSNNSNNNNNNTSQLPISHMPMPTI
eukprot:86669_1